VPPGALALARAPQTNKEGWVAEKRKKHELLETAAGEKGNSS